MKTPLSMIASAGKFAVDSGIVRRADLTLELDNERLAEVLQSATLAALEGMPQVEISDVNKGPVVSGSNDVKAAHLANETRTRAATLKTAGEPVEFDVPDGPMVNPHSISPHVATIKIHHDRIAEGIAKGIANVLKSMSSQMTEEEGHFSYKLLPGDDGKKVRITIDSRMLENFSSMSKGQKMTVDGILDPSDIPQNKEEMMEKLQTLMGGDPESKEVVIDGQVLLKLLHAILNDNHEKSAKDKDADVTQPTFDEKYARFQSFMNKIPGAKVRREDDLITIEMDMKQLSDASKAMTDFHLSQIKGVTLPPENAEDRFVTTAKLDFNQLTQQALAVATDQLNGIKGVRIRTNNGATTATFNTDVMKGDLDMAGIVGQLEKVVSRFGINIAQEAIGAKPPSVVGSVAKHFIKGPGKPGQQL